MNTSSSTLEHRPEISHQSSIDLRDHRTNPEIPDYVNNYWSDFAVAELSRPDSSIPQALRGKFMEACRKNERFLVNDRKTALANPSVHTITEWYRRLGSMNSLRGVEGDIHTFYNALASQEGFLKEPDAVMLAGNLAHELGNVSADDQAPGYLSRAIKLYEKAMELGSNDMRYEEVREAKAHWYDARFRHLSVGLRSGRINQADFNEHYERLHVGYIKTTHGIANMKNGRERAVRDGEIYEWYGVAALRHQVWSNERFGEIEVRRAMPREDAPYDGFNRNKKDDPNRARSMPRFAFDVQLEEMHADTQPAYVQLKSDNDPAPYAKSILTWQYRGRDHLGDHVEVMTGAMLRSYDFKESDADAARLSHEMDLYHIAGV